MTKYYGIASGYDIDEFTEGVQESLEKYGWILQGGVSVVYDPTVDKMAYFQSMTNDDRSVEQPIDKIGFKYPRAVKQK